ncbi:hypothetical protein DENSPDRAFT_833940 [Dentipellis sp. KUC8613]|nr:hypothetical protein DENSPDRAFT_833940 [Dentipellis sp. KUC8613]
MVWGPDADLTLLGQNQARELGAAWQMELSRGMPLPQRFYCSPMTRALHTCKLTFERILPDDHVGPVVLENLREWYGKNPCDKRSARSVITARFPSVEFDGDFTEEDTLWTHERESRAHVNERVGTVLDKVFSASKDDVYISITAHGGFFRALTDIIGRGEYALPPGGILPVVVKSSPKEGVY